MDLKDKVSVVTGAAQGLGRSFVEILLKHGSKVALIDVDASRGNELKISLEKKYGQDLVEFYVADVSSEEEFKGAFQKILGRFGHIDIFCNNAGIINEKDWEKTIAINLCGVVRGTYLATEHMKKEKGGNGGVIINIASLAGLGPMPTAPIYTATKHGVVGFSRAMAAASTFGDYGIRINVICPWFVKTNLLTFFDSEEHFGDFFPLKGVTDAMMQSTGCLETDDVAKAFLALVRDESRNGEVMMIDMEGAAYVTLPQKSREVPCTAVKLQ